MRRDTATGRRRPDGRATSDQQVEVLVAGAGVVGSAAALELVRRGHEVLLLERFERGHARGSSHGAVRIFRLSYPDPDYVELGLQALSDWRRLERDSRRTLITTTGALDVGPSAAPCAEAMTSMGVEVQTLDPPEVLEAYGLLVDGPAFFHGPAGVLAAEGAVEAQLELAGFAGADIRFGVSVESAERMDRGVRVTTSLGSINAKVLVVAAGAWAPSITVTAGITLPVLVTCEQISYFRSGLNPSAPVLIDRSSATDVKTPVAPIRYLVPQAHGAPGVKVGLHGFGRPVDPEDGPFETDPDIVSRCGAWLSAVTGAGVSEILSETCLYTNAPDEDFILQRQGDVVVVSACSGHGFKFAPRMGRAVADLVENKDPNLPGRLGEWWRPA